MSRQEFTIEEQQTRLKNHRIAIRENMFLNARTKLAFIKRLIAVSPVLKAAIENYTMKDSEEITDFEFLGCYRRMQHKAAKLIDAYQQYFADVDMEPEFVNPAIADRFLAACHKIESAFFADSGEPHLGLFGSTPYVMLERLESGKAMLKQVQNLRRDRNFAVTAAQIADDFQRQVEEAGAQAQAAVDIYLVDGPLFAELEGVEAENGVEDKAAEATAGVEAEDVVEDKAAEVPAGVGGVPGTLFAGARGRATGDAGLKGGDRRPDSGVDEGEESVGASAAKRVRTV
ncbi:MAG: hypothetical protein P1U40_08390 [Coxiellaceae bacterium]|nr:hypothetical protein [Coxiellaceae bacterium]